MIFCKAKGLASANRGHAGRRHAYCDFSAESARSTLDAHSDKSTVKLDEFPPNPPIEMYANSPVSSLPAWPLSQEPFEARLRQPTDQHLVDAGVTLWALLNRPPKRYPDQRSRVVSQKSYNVRSRIELTANVERH